MSNIGPVNAVKNSYKFSRKYISNSILIFIITIAILFFSGVVIQILNLVNLTKIGVLIGIAGFINFLVSKTALLLVDMFKFRILKQLSGKRLKS